MPRNNRAVAGGLLRGVGDALVRRADIEREDELIMRQTALERARELRRELVTRDEGRLDREARSGEATADRTHDAEQRRLTDERQATEAGLEHERRRGLLTGVEVGDDRRARGVTAGGETIDLGFDAPPPRTGGSGTGDPFPEQEWKAVVGRHTAKDELGAETTDWAAAANDFERMGRRDLAQIARGPNPEQGGSGSPELDEFNDLARQAQQEASRRLSGPGGSAASSAPAPGGRTPGAGTQDSPYLPETEEQFNALPAGSIFKDPDDGRLYRKK